MKKPTYSFSLLLAGGSGTRLWPLSRDRLPKHLLSLNGGETLLQQAARRLLPIVPPEQILTVTHKGHLLEAREQLHTVNPALAERILAEPVANNTLPAIAWAAALIEKENPDAVVGVFPSDHVISDEAAFHRDLHEALEVASKGYLVTFGIQPTGPETGYGYIKSGCSLYHSRTFEAEAFIEKPDRKTAQDYLQQGNYYWNSGMFVFRVSDFQREIKRLEPVLYEAMQQIADSGNNPSVIEKIYPTIKKISIDYGIMEKAEKVAVIPATFDWSDLGSWEAIYKIKEKDENGNVTEGRVLAEDTHSSLLISKKGVLATVGLKETVVIQTDDAILVSPRDRVQEVKKIVEQLKAKESPLAETHPMAHRPWGSYTVLEEGTGYKIKRIVVNPGGKLSLQRHRHRAEHWVVVEGTAKVTNGTKEVFLKENESTFIPQGENHRLENPGTTPLTIIEIQTGPYLGEDDIERLDDVYGRVPLTR